MTANSEATTSEQEDDQPQPVTEEDPTRKAISEALEQICRNLEITINNWDTLGEEWRAGLLEELASNRRELEEVAERIKERLSSVNVL
jgi:hypothetical protein